MKKLRGAERVGVAALLAVALAGCPYPEPSGVSEEVQERRVEASHGDTARLPRPELDAARAAATALGQELAGLVFATMQEEGTEAAVRVCSEVAQERTAAHGRDGVSVRRVGDRFRNPMNAPDDAELRELQHMAAAVSEGRTPEEVVRLVRRGTDRSLHLMRPILVQPGCLACHGDVEEIAPEVRQILADRYPDDRAVGYSAGDLRGAISVRVPVVSGESP